MDFELDDLNSISKELPNSTEESIKEAKSEEDKWFTPESRRYEETTDLRSLLAKVFSFVIFFWLVCVILILVGNHKYYKLSDTVLKTLLTTTTIQVLGMMLIILYDLFPGGKNKVENKNKD